MMMLNWALALLLDGFDISAAQLLLKLFSVSFFGDAFALTVTTLCSSLCVCGVSAPLAALKSFFLLICARCRRYNGFK